MSLLRSLTLVACLLVPAATAAPLGAQAAEPVSPEALQEAAAPTVPDVDPAAVPAAPAVQQQPFTGAPEAAPGGLPARAAPPRTLRAYWHVFIAFALAWALLFGYALSLGRRFARLEAELRRG